MTPLPDGVVFPPDSWPASDYAPASKTQVRCVRWMLIRSLSERHKPRIRVHLQALPERDRYLRFGYLASDAQIKQYVDLIDLSRDDPFGVYNRRLDLIAHAHLASLPGNGEAEFGVSVLPSHRGQGIGGRLFDHATVRARNRGVHTLLIHALSENVAMLCIARRAGAMVDQAGGEALARVRLPPHDLRSHLQDMAATGAAELDYRFKVQARRVAVMADTIEELKHQIGAAHAARERIAHPP
jgi:GNAT superfamily N-acetyltransferase